MDAHVYVAEYELRLLDGRGNIVSQFEGLDSRSHANEVARQEVEPGQRFQIIAWGEDGSERLVKDHVRGS